MENELYKKMYYHLFNAVTDAIRADTKRYLMKFSKKHKRKQKSFILTGNE